MLNGTTRQPLIARRLTQPLALEDGKSPRILKAILYTISGFVLSAVVWAALTQVQELTIAQGVEMGRPSEIRVEVTAERGRLTPKVSGSAVRVFEGKIEA